MQFEKFILFGTGDYYSRLYHWFSDRNVIAIMDNDHNKQGKTIDGHPVIAPEEIIGFEYDAVVILSFYYAAMKKQLIDIGVPENRIYHFYDLHDLFGNETGKGFQIVNKGKSILLLSHDLSLGGPALALYHAASILKKAGYEVVYGSMIDGELRSRLEESYIPVIIDERLQICTMRELQWTNRFDLVICNTINFHVFLSDRSEGLPVIWWLHDSPFFYEGIAEGKLGSINTENMKILSVGPVPSNAIKKMVPGIETEDLIYGVSNVV